MHITALIPARLDSQRLKHKLLIEVEHKPILQHVYENIFESQLFDEVIIATDSKRIEKIAKAFGAKVFMTAKTHKSGTDRIAEVARKIKTDIIVNVQGDEPLISQSHLRKIIRLITREHVGIATLCSSFSNQQAVGNPNNVKVLFDKNKKALYFSRSLIPFPRNKAALDSYHHHIGIYAFRRKVLLRISSLPQSNLEKVESLEQLRWLENGFEIYVDKVEGPTISIDTVKDLKEFKAYLKKT